MKFAKHNTTKENKLNILKTGKFKPSKSGWAGPGVYGFTNDTGTEGKGVEAVYFQYDNLKIADGKPPELSQTQWNSVRVKSSIFIDKLLARIGYDGKINGNWIIIFPSSVNKLKPIEKI